MRSRGQFDGLNRTPTMAFKIRKRQSKRRSFPWKRYRIVAFLAAAVGSSLVVSCRPGHSIHFSQGSIINSNVKMISPPSGGPLGYDHSARTSQMYVAQGSSALPPMSSQQRAFVQVKESDKIRWRDGYNWAPYVIEEYKLLFFTIQKTGCTIWKQLFRRILGHQNWATGKTFPPKQVGLIMLTDYNLSEATRMINDPTWTRAIFVRDPKERFLSAYLEKAVESNYARRKCCRSKKDTDCALKLKSFEGFFNITERCYDTHWAAQADRLDPWYCPLLDFVGHTETAAADARILLERLGAWEKYGRSGWGKYGNESIFESTSNVKHKTSNSSEESNARLAKYYTPPLEKLVEGRLAGDYAIHQYNLTLQRIYYSR